jgi:hypothetical protein
VGTVVAAKEVMGVGQSGRWQLCWHWSSHVRYVDGEVAPVAVAVGEEVAGVIGGNKSVCLRSCKSRPSRGLSKLDVVGSRVVVIDVVRLRRPRKISVGCLLIPRCLLDRWRVRVGWE